jgi:CTP-dependent riboflavin kinase
MLEAELQAAGMDKKAINDALRIERQAFNQAQKDYQNMFRTQEGTQRYSGFGDGNYYAPTYQYAGPEAEAVRQRQVQAQQFLQQYKIPQFYNQGRTAIGIKSPQAYALSQAMADGQVTEDELTGQYGQYFNPNQARRAVRNINAIQPFVGNQNITAESFENRLKPVKGMEGVYQTRLAGGSMNNVMGVFRDMGNGQYEYLGAAPTRTKPESGGLFGNILRIGGALIAPFNPVVGSLASGIGTLAAGGNLGQALVSGVTNYAGASLGGIPGVISIPAGVSSAIGGGIAAATPVTPQQPPIPSVAPGIV